MHKLRGISAFLLLLACGCSSTRGGTFNFLDTGAGEGGAVDGQGSGDGALFFDVQPFDTTVVPRLDVVSADNGSTEGGVVPPGDGGAQSDAGRPPMRVCVAAEVCNNALDDDCDGMVDEDCPCIPGTTQQCYIHNTATAGIGICSLGSQRCMGTGEFGRWSTCEGAVGPSNEQCNGVDDNCDGVVDDGCECRIGSQRPCYGGPPGTRMVGACADGMQTCIPGPDGFGSRWGGCGNDTRPGTETCNGMDDDCNGTVDDGCGCTPGMMRTCYGGPAGTSGQGICRPGTQTCRMNGTMAAWGPCENQVLPASEVCDNMDNNCDGTADDGCQCRMGDMRPCYEGAMSTRGVGTCRDGMQSCVLGPSGVGSTWGTCSGQTLPSGELCDGLDNNCNGAVDETCVCRAGEMRACYTGATGTAGVGACRQGMQPCVIEMGAARWGNCSGEVLPNAEVCGDNIDNNCNGMLDDGCTCTLNMTRMCYPGPAGTAGVGVCRAGTETCVAGAGGMGTAWGTCMGAVVPATEMCGDNIDNNCNGMVDDGCACRSGETRPCYTGPAGTRGVGVCAGGTESCTITGGTAAWGTCTGQITPGTETCDGRDNDCDGMTDEGCPCTPSVTRMCYSGPMGTAGVGICRAGSQTCTNPTGSNPMWSMCSGEVLPATEVCGDNMDNNCNGMVDDGCTCTLNMTRSCYTGPMGTAGVGTCRAGSQTCVAGPGGVGTVWGACTGEVLPAAETCNMMDRNCNNMVDDGCTCTLNATRSCYSGAMGTAGVGRCRAGTQTCVAGTGGVVSTWGTCTGEVLPTAETCNMMDDNCNNMVDDGISCSTGPTVMCPAAVTAPAGTSVNLTATATPSTGLTYRWTATSMPVGGLPVIGAPTSLSTSFTSAIVGTYTLTFTATDGMGRTAMCTTMVTMQGHGLRAELVWDTGTATNRVDLDLHMHNSTGTWFATTGPDRSRDCFYASMGRTLSWDAATTLDDPFLDTDNQIGFGPENIRVDEPVINSQTYSIGVHYYYGNSIPMNPPAVANPTVRIYCGQVLRGTYTPPAPLTGTTTGTFSTNQFWRVARVVFTSASTCNITPLGNVIPTNTSPSNP